MAFDLISIGDCTIDHFFKIHDAYVDLSIDKTHKELCIDYGNKIPAEEYYQLVAGNNVNNAIASVKLGLKTAIYTHVGSDLTGQHIIKILKEKGVDTKYIAIQEDMSSNASSVISFKGERTILVYHQNWQYNLPDLDQTRWIYFSSLSASFSKTNIIFQLENFLERTGAKLAYNPGTLQLEYGVKKFPKLLLLTHLFIVNSEEAKKILGDKSDRLNIKKLLQGLADLGPRMVVITAGKEGSYGFDGEKYYEIGAFPSKVTDMTGAGDAYSAGALAGLFYGQDFKEALRWGAANSASTIEEVGAQNGLLNYEQMRRQLKEHPKITAKEI